MVTGLFKVWIPYLTLCHLHKKISSHIFDRLLNIVCPVSQTLPKPNPYFISKETLDIACEINFCKLRTTIYPASELANNLQND